jgi:hypothetical protein
VHILDRLLGPVELGGVHEQGVDATRLLEEHHQSQIAAQAVAGDVDAFQAKVIEQLKDILGHPLRPEGELLVLRPAVATQVHQHNPVAWRQLGDEIRPLAGNRSQQAGQQEERLPSTVAVGVVVN